jgi:hypothetical protein
MDLPSDEHLHRAVTELGEPAALFRVSPARLVAKLALGVLLVLLGLVANYFWWVDGPATFDHFVFHLLYIMPLIGGALLYHMHRNRGLYILIYPAGLLRLRRGEVDSFPWAEIEQVGLKVQRADGAEFARDPHGSAAACWLAADLPTFKLWDSGLTVTRTDGTEAHFGPALSDYAALAEEVQKRTFATLWPSVRARFYDGARVSFGEVELDSDGVHHSGKLLRWRDLKEVAVAQGMLSFKSAGKWLPWALVGLNSVPNPHLLFALVDEAQRFYAPPESEPQPHETAQP